MHVYPERFDAQPGALLGAPQVSAEQYRQGQTMLDLDRAVVVAGQWLRRCQCIAALTAPVVRHAAIYTAWPTTRLRWWDNKPSRQIRNAGATAPTPFGPRSRRALRCSIVTAPRRGLLPWRRLRQVRTARTKTNQGFAHAGNARIALQCAKLYQCMLRRAH
jgi:hypothetical protein